MNHPGGRRAGAPPTPAATPRQHRLPALIAALTLLVACVLIFSKTMQRSLDHDEHLFVATGALLAREGLLPYRDVPYFHSPYVPLLDAVLFRASDHLLLAARLLSIACAGGLLLLVQRATTRLFASHGPLAAALAGSAAVVLLMFQPLFSYTTGLAWNHDGSLLPAVGATLLLALRPGCGRAALGAGLLLGLAIGARISALPLAAPLLLLAALGHERNRVRRGLLFAAGCALGLLPLLLVAAFDPSAAWFGNIGYAATNTGWRRITGFEGPMTLPLKLAELGRHVAGGPGGAALLVALLAGLLLRRRDAPLRPVLAPLLVVPFAAFGALAPTPCWPQYFYALVPFVVLAAVAALGQAGPGRARRSAALGVLALAAGVTAVAGLDEYRTLGNLSDPSQWTPLRVHATGRRLAAELPAGATVVTLSPIFALEGGLSVPPAFASGPFGFRSAPLMTEGERARFGLLGVDDLDAGLADRPPAAVHVGHERHGDDLLSEWAQARGARTLDLGEAGILHLFSAP